MKVKTSGLSGLALSYALAKATGEKHIVLNVEKLIILVRDDDPLMSWRQFDAADWSRTGPISDRFEVELKHVAGSKWLAECIAWDDDSSGAGAGIATGPCRLSATARAVVSSELGEEVELPPELEHV